MRYFGMAIALACVFSGFGYVEAQESEGDTYIPRSERDTESAFTFKGSSKGLVIIDHQTGDVTRYTTKRQKSLHRMTPEAEASARSAWQTRQEAAAEIEAQAAEDAEREAAELSAAESEATETAESAPAPDDNGDSDDDE